MDKYELDKKIYQLNDMIRSIERLNANCEANMKRLNEMMLQLKGIIAMVRPSAKRNDWYGEELHGDGTMLCSTSDTNTVKINKQIELQRTN